LDENGQVWLLLSLRAGLYIALGMNPLPQV